MTSCRKQWDQHCGDELAGTIVRRHCSQFSGKNTSVFDSKKFAVMLAVLLTPATGCGSGGSGAAAIPTATAPTPAAGDLHAWCAESAKLDAQSNGPLSHATPRTFGKQMARFLTTHATEIAEIERTAPSPIHDSTRTVVQAEHRIANGAPMSLLVSDPTVKAAAKSLDAFQTRYCQ